MNTLRWLIAALALACSGCATLAGDSTQSLRIEAFTASGESVAHARCRLQNSAGSYQVVTPGAVSVQRSASDLSIDCAADGQPPAHAIVTSRVGAGMFGNLLFGGAVGAAIDHSKGTAYLYPTWLRLVFGRTLGFDRADYEEAQPTPAFELRDGHRQRLPWPPASGR